MDALRQAIDTVRELCGPTWWSLAVGLLLAMTIWMLVAKWNAIPFRIIGEFGDEEECRAKVRYANEHQVAARNLPFPTGWFGLMFADELVRGDVKPVYAFGKALVAFRDDAGEVHVTDSRCPHLGADMAYGGRVQNDSLVCPFHAWRFRGHDGRCVDIPYAPNCTIPSSAQVKSYRVVERNYLIYIWYDEMEREPLYSVDSVIDENKFVIKAKSLHRVNCHIQEIPENGGDFAHLSVVHGAALLAGLDLKTAPTSVWNIGTHEWQYKWMPCEDEKERSAFQLRHRFNVLNKFYIRPFEVAVAGTQLGPALVFMHFTTWWGTFYILQTLLPQETFRQKVYHYMIAPSWIPNWFARWYLLGENLQFERDMVIWNRKKFIRKPLLVKSAEDTLLQTWRRWYSQFYPESPVQKPADPNDW